ncbi:ABC transporter substrate-binding protein [Streptomyces wuyuanensis]|uniref:Multiple sugar transport system substrate-binding protein n=1 Tax=Streptomyces wuyuanensis TaxID=1196353 RepID=A0A1G9PFC6_9ACTN|nr:sugar ABC transporter substrate-binding protein [Streptomyces wuyuanensis]SDL97552.1 multiple sugar transport system substrate-binding protein [Streptomyces wuyuanensis]
MKTGFKRATVPLALLTLTTLTAAGCGGDSGAESKKVTVWMYPVIMDPKANAAYWDGIEKGFEAKEKGVDLSIEQLPWENRDQKLATAFGSGKGPDVVLLGPDQIPQYQANGAIQPVDRAIGEARDAFRPNALEAMSQDGKVYAAPIYHTVTSTLYNKKLLEKAGITEPPSTWDAIRAAAPKLKQAGASTLDYSASNEASLNMSFYPLLWQAGGKVFDDGGRKAAFNGPEGVEALTFLVDLYKSGAVPKSAMNNANLFTDQALGKQQVAMGYTNTPADAVLAEKAWGKGNVIVGPALTGPGKQVCFGMPGGLGINARSKNVAGAEKFIAYMVQPAQIESMGKAGGFFSPRTDVTVPNDSTYAKEYQEALNHTYPGEPNPAARQLMALISPEIQAALTGKKSPKAALDAAAAEADELLARQR